MKNIVLITLLLFSISCVPKKREQYLLENIAILESKLDSCENGADKLLASMELAFKENDFSLCKIMFHKIKYRHPEKPEFQEAKKLYDEIISIEKKRELEEAIWIKNEEKRKSAALNKLKKEYDDITGITWYRNPYFIHYTNTNKVSIYMGEMDSHVWLRLKMSYAGDDWIFFDEAYLSYDGKTYEIPFGKYEDKDSDHDSGDVWEWIDISVSESLKIYLKNFVNGNDLKMRLIGKYTKTRNLTLNEKQGIKDILAGYELLKEKQKKK